ADIEHRLNLLARCPRASTSCQKTPWLAHKHGTLLRTLRRALSAPNLPPCLPVPLDQSRHPPNRLRSSAIRGFEKNDWLAAYRVSRHGSLGRRPSPTSIVGLARSPARLGGISCRRRAHCHSCP